MTWRSKSDTPLPLANNLTGAIREWGVHERRECLCRSVRTVRGASDLACHVRGTPEHKDQLSRRAHMQEIAGAAREQRRRVGAVA